MEKKEAEKDLYGESYPRISRIQCLHLHNFKSFKGDHAVGPFLNFTAIVGPNGSGKSNLLDAVCFILAIRTTHMREGNLRQFMYRPPADQSDTVPTGKAWVIMEFMSQEGTLLKFKRVLNNKGITQYFLEDAPVSHEAYVRELEKHRLLAQTRSYFLVMQGEIDSILQGSSKELTRVIEEISGSREYKAQYDDLRTRLEQSQLQIAAVSKNIQELRSEKRKAKGVKANVEAFEKARERVAQLQVELYATMCAFYEKKVKELASRVDELDDEIRRQNEEKDGLMAQQKELHDATTKLNAEETERERDKEQLKEARVRNVKDLRRIEDRLDLCRKELSAKTVARESLEKRIAEQQARREELEEKKQMAEQECVQLVGEMERAEGQKAGPKYREEYYTIKHRVEAQTFDIKSEVQKLTAHLGVAKRKLTVHEERLAGLHSQSEELKVRHEGITVDDLQQKIQEKELEARQFGEKYSEATEKYQDMCKELSALELQLAGAEYEQKKIEHERDYKMQRGHEYHLIEQLKTKVRGCRGLLVQLVNACEKKYEVAVKVGLGKYLTHLIVDDESAASSCNISLKDAGVMKDILILSNVPKKASVLSSSDLSTVASANALQLVDVIEYNSNVKRLKEAIMYIAGRRVVCENMQSAKDLREKGIRDIITLGGDVMKQGVITGGYNEMLLGLEFQQKDYTHKHKEAVERVTKLKTSIAEIRALHYDKQMGEYKEKIESANFALRSLEKQVKAAYAERDRIKDELASLADKTSKLESDREKASARADEMTKEIAEYQQTVTDLERTAFKDFCKKLKIASITEYEGADLVAANEFHNRKTRLMGRIEELSAQLELLNANQYADKLAKLSATLERLETSRKGIEEEKSAELDRGRKIEEEYEAVGQALDRVSEKRDEISQKNRALEEQIKGVIGVIDDTKKELITSMCQIKNNARLKIRTIDELKLKNIPVAIEPITAKEKMLTKTMDVDYAVEYEKYDIDMSIVTSKDLEEKEKTLLENITVEEKKVADFNALALMKGEEGDDLEEIDKEIEKERKALEAASKEHENQEKSFKQVKEARRQAFKACYEQLSAHIDSIYQELTRTEDTGFTYGGHAILVPENVGEPYNGEIQYAPTPPGKRVVYELEQLSGGEKALAALGLVLAVQKYQRSPILILDEVDAHLDVKNVKKLAQFLKKSVEESGFQCIVVSHKETLVEVFDSILGVAHSKPKQSSLVYSLDMRPFAA